MLGMWTIGLVLWSSSSAGFLLS
uniref:Uncharacterized protein n=1 Tax=Anguilla anguilla TaxID=7936 RepID=A0A0E9PLV2_ANGAN